MLVSVDLNIYFYRSIYFQISLLTPSFGVVGIRVSLLIIPKRMLYTKYIIITANRVNTKIPNICREYSKLRSFFIYLTYSLAI